MECEVGSRLLQYKRRVTWNLPANVHFLTFSCYQRRRYLRSDTCCQWLGSTVRAACDKLEFRLWAYVFMPEHVYLLVYPTRREYKISSLLQLIKLPISRRVRFRLKNAHLEFFTRNTGPDGEFNFWQPGGGFDRNLSSWKRIINAAAYCHNNPVKRGLVPSPEQWKWSSFKTLMVGGADNWPIRIDDWHEPTIGPFK
jgi:putative transposase